MVPSPNRYIYIYLYIYRYFSYKWNVNILYSHVEKVGFIDGPKKPFILGKEDCVEYEHAVLHMWTKLRDLVTDERHFSSLVRKLTLHM